MSSHLNVTAATTAGVTEPVTSITISSPGASSTSGSDKASSSKAPVFSLDLPGMTARWIHACFVEAVLCVLHLSCLGVSSNRSLKSTNLSLHSHARCCSLRLLLADIDPNDSVAVRQYMARCYEDEQFKANFEADKVSRAFRAEHASMYGAVELPLLLKPLFLSLAHSTQKDVVSAVTTQANNASASTVTSANTSLPSLQSLPFRLHVHVLLPTAMPSDDVGSASGSATLSMANAYGKDTQVS